MRRTILAAALSAALSGQAAASGIPVIDASNLAQAVAQVNHALTQIETLRQQLAQAQALYQSVTGIRNLGDALSNPLARAALPADLRQALQGIDDTGQVVGRARAVLEGQRLPESLDDAEAYLLRRQAELAALQQATGEAAYSETTARLERLDRLTREINRASDLQATAALQARLAAEQASVQAETNRLLAALAANEAAERLAAQQRGELARRTWRGNGTVPSLIEVWGSR